MQAFNSGSCTHTTTEDNPWWAVDLGDHAVISYIHVVNRQDSTASALICRDCSPCA